MERCTRRVFNFLDPLPSRSQRIRARTLIDFGDCTVSRSFPDVHKRRQAFFALLSTSSPSCRGGIVSVGRPIITPFYILDARDE